MTSQQSADRDLARWQDLRIAGLTPSERLERLVQDFWQPPADEILYDATLRQVSEEMADA